MPAHPCERCRARAGDALPSRADRAPDGPLLRRPEGGGIVRQLLPRSTAAREASSTTSPTGSSAPPQWAARPAGSVASDRLGTPPQRNVPTLPIVMLGPNTKAQGLSFTVPSGAPIASVSCPVRLPTVYASHAWMFTDACVGWLMLPSGTDTS